MFSFNPPTLTQQGRELNIVRWEVWFQTPFGLIEKLQDAVTRCVENDLDPSMVVQPIPVAVDEAGRYEIILRA